MLYTIAVVVLILWLHGLVGRRSLWSISPIPAPDRSGAASMTLLPPCGVPRRGWIRSWFARRALTLQSMIRSTRAH